MRTRARTRAPCLALVSALLVACCCAPSLCCDEWVEIGSGSIDARYRDNTVRISPDASVYGEYTSFKIIHTSGSLSCWASLFDESNPENNLDSWDLCLEGGDDRVRLELLIDDITDETDMLSNDNLVAWGRGRRSTSPFGWCYYSDANGVATLSSHGDPQDIICIDVANVVLSGDTIIWADYSESRLVYANDDNRGSVDYTLYGCMAHLDDTVHPSPPASVPCTGEGNNCHKLAYCDDNDCICFEGIYGPGDGEDGCTSTAWTVRFNMEIPFGMPTSRGKLLGFHNGQRDFANLLLQGAAPVTEPEGFLTTMHHEVTPLPPGGKILTINSIFSSKAEADNARDNLADALETGPSIFGVNLAPPDSGRRSDSPVPVEPRVYTWLGRTTDDVIPVLPTGMTVESVSFDTSCMATGCWVINVIYTTGEDNFNTFYMPMAEGDDTGDEDFDYTDIQDTTWNNLSPADTFLPSNHPCRTSDYVPVEGLLEPPNEVTACCIPEFMAVYRPLQFFINQIPVTKTWCDRSQTSPFLGDKAFERLDDGPILPSEQITYMVSPNNAVQGYFKGMPDTSSVTTLGIVDPFLRQYQAEIRVDEVDLRRKAGMLRGTPGVEYTVDTFIGLANFKPTGLKFLDPAVTQVAIHLEKTNFFSVSSHGSNDYTFLEYVNLRLVAVYRKDDDFSGLDEASTRTVRTDSKDAAHYVQVTFTLGQKYGVNDAGSAGLIPMDSVRASQGTFFSETGMAHMCLDYANSEASFGSGDRQLFDDRFSTTGGNAQDCAPAAQMCASPSAVPDQFVSFNIPLGIDWFPSPQPDLSSNVFVDLVVNARDVEAEAASGKAPNAGGAAFQMKTTLSASIPVVEGGVNIFCDGVTAKTDLKDVADVDLIIGSASDLAEVSRLTILENIASTSLDEVEGPAIDTASIESGLMTLVIKGNATYFEQSTATQGYSLELEDVITVHLLEQTPCDGSTAPPFSCIFDEVKALMAQAMAENDGDTDGYPLNGAFSFRVNRKENRAHLEPSAALRTLCPFSPAPPAAGSMPLQTCITRRDVRYRGFPHRAGGWSTAMEVALPGASLGEEARFMQTVLGQSAYADALGRSYAGVIADRYDALGHELNGRYNRAYWINPGYEWTPAQTGGSSVFSLSQQIFLFALINLDEGWVLPESCAALGGVPEAEGGFCFFTPGGVAQHFQDAQTTCAQQEGAMLASIHSAQEQAAAKQVLIDNGWLGQNVRLGGIKQGGMMTGGTDFEWVDGTPVDYTNWASGQPDTNTQACVVFYANADGRWDNQGCFSPLPFVCKVPLFAPMAAPSLHLPPAPARRMLLQSVGETGASMASSSVSFATSPQAMLASAFDVSADLVASFRVSMSLTPAEACMPLNELQGALRATLADYLSSAASAVETVQVVGMQVDKGGEECDDTTLRRRTRRRLQALSSATAAVEMVVVFAAGTAGGAQLDLEQLQAMTGVEAVEPLDVSPKVSLSTLAVKPAPSDPNESPSDSNAASDVDAGSADSLLVGAIAGACAGVVLLAGAVFLWLRARQGQGEGPKVVQSAINVEDLKRQLQEDV